MWRQKTYRFVSLYIFWLHLFIFNCAIFFLILIWIPIDEQRISLWRMTFCLFIKPLISKSINILFTQFFSLKRFLVRIICFFLRFYWLLSNLVEKWGGVTGVSIWILSVLWRFLTIKQDFERFLIVFLKVKFRYNSCDIFFLGLKVFVSIDRSIWVGHKEGVLFRVSS